MYVVQIQNEGNRLIFFKKMDLRDFTTKLQNDIYFQLDKLSMKT